MRIGHSAQSAATVRTSRSPNFARVPVLRTHGLGCPIDLMPAILGRLLQWKCPSPLDEDADMFVFHGGCITQIDLLLESQCMPPRHNGTITLLGLLTALTPLSATCIYRVLPSSRSSAKEAMSSFRSLSFFLGLAIGRRFTDRFRTLRRKLPLYAGLVLFVLASAGCASQRRSTSSHRVAIPAGAWRLLQPGHRGAVVRDLLSA